MPSSDLPPDRPRASGPPFALLGFDPLSIYASLRRPGPGRTASPPAGPGVAGAGVDGVDDRIPRASTATARLRRSPHILDRDDVPPANPKPRQDQAVRKNRRYRRMAAVAGEMSGLGVNGARLMIARFGVQACQDVLDLMATAKDAGELPELRNPPGYFVTLLHDHHRHRRGADVDLPELCAQPPRQAGRTDDTITGSGESLATDTP